MKMPVAGVLAICATFAGAALATGLIALADVLKRHHTSNARAAARTLAVSHAFAVRANRSARSPQSAPEYRRGSNSASASPSASAS